MALFSSESSTFGTGKGGEESNLHDCMATYKIILTLEYWGGDTKPVLRSAALYMELERFCRTLEPGGSWDIGETNSNIYPDDKKLTFKPARKRGHRTTRKAYWFTTSIKEGLIRLGKCDCDSWSQKETGYFPTLSLTGGKSSGRISAANQEKYMDGAVDIITGFLDKADCCTSRAFCS